MPSSDAPTGEKFDSWAYLEVMGHKRLAGKVTEATLAGGAFIRIDVPAVGEIAGYTQYFSPGSIFSITPTSEEIVRHLAERYREQPISVYDLRSISPSKVEPVQLEDYSRSTPMDMFPPDDYEPDGFDEEQD